MIGLILILLYWALSQSAVAYALKWIIDSINTWDHQESIYHHLLPPMALFLGVGYSMGILFRLYDWLVLRVIPQLRAEMVEQMFAYVSHHSYRYFQQEFSGSLGNKLSDMARNGTTVIIDFLETFFARTMMVLLAIITLTWVNACLGLIVLFWSLGCVVCALLVSKQAQQYTELAATARSRSIGKLVDALSNILTIKLFAKESFERRYLRHALGAGVQKEQIASWYLLKVKALYALIFAGLTTSTMAILLYEYQKGFITVGDFALTLSLITALIEQLFELANHLAPFAEQVGICQQALSVIRQSYDLQDLPTAKALHVPRGEIRFENVTFHYPNGSQVFVNQSITLHPGEKVGLVGASGSGKSTFVHLILRFFDVNQGRILIDGQDIHTTTQASLRRQIAMIPQDPMLFHRSLFENIRYGSEHSTREEIIAYAKQAHCHEFISALPEGYDSLVGERGIKLSGGQRQRIAIARAMAKQAPILILDEATSALDSITEQYIQESLQLLMAGRTTLVIAHRLSTLFRMDRILVFQEGSIIEDGTHEELLRQQGLYAQLWDMQAGGFIGETDDAIDDWEPSPG